ncbi:MAG: TrbI/VirB10 family protein [Pleurocapsa sp. MO_226.B13]|nr:TrbI/VirB10 family protein [Pleurocapsa sp. MO_226.B13]
MKYSDSDSNFEEIKSFLIEDDDEAEKSPTSAIPFNIEELQEVPYYKRPSVQLLTVIGIGLPIIWLIMAAFKGGERPTIAQSIPQIDREKAKLVSALNEERERIRQLELANALYSQKLEIVVPEPKTKPKAAPKPQPKATPVRQITTTPAPKPKPVVVQRKPQPVYRPTAPQPIRTTPVTRPQPIAVSPTAPKPDPMQQWLAIADQGHYTTAHVTQKSSARLVSKEVPVIHRATNSENYPLLNDAQVRSALDETPLLSDGDGVARINGKSRPSKRVVTSELTAIANTRKTNIIDIGSSAKATLESAVVWSVGTPSQSNKKYLLRLKEDFENIDGTVVLPEDTRLIATVRNYDNSGLLSMEVTSILHQGRKIDVTAGALLIEGKKGSPIKADLKQKGDSDFWANVGSVVAPGVERALDSASDTLIVQNGSVYRSNSNRDPLASGISGVADGVSRTLNRRIQRNQRETILSYFQLDSGKTVYLKAYEDIVF